MLKLFARRALAITAIAATWLATGWGLYVMWQGHFAVQAGWRRGNFPDSADINLFSIYASMLLVCGAVFGTIVLWRDR